MTPPLVLPIHPAYSMPEATKVMLKPRALRKMRPDLASVSTMGLLERAAFEAERLRAENKRLTSELSAAKKRLAALEKRTTTARKAVAVAEPEVAPVEKKARPRRQALGAGLSRFLTARSK